MFGCFCQLLNTTLALALEAVCKGQVFLAPVNLLLRINVGDQQLQRNTVQGTAGRCYLDAAGEVDELQQCTKQSFGQADAA